MIGCQAGVAPSRRLTRVTSSAEAAGDSFTTNPILLRISSLRPCEATRVMPRIPKISRTRVTLIMEVSREPKVDILANLFYS